MISNRGFLILALGMVLTGCSNKPASQHPDIQRRIHANYIMLKEMVQKTSGFDFVESAYINNLHTLALPLPMRHHNMEWITAGALDFIEKAGDQPFFLYLATTLPHDSAPVSSMFADPNITPAGLLEETPNVQPGRLEVIEKVKQAGFPEEAAPYTWLDDGIGAVITKGWKNIAIRFPQHIQDQITPENNQEFNQEGTRFSANNPNGQERVRYHADTLYPACFDRDQLYHLEVDPDEQVNLAGNDQYQVKLLEMKQLLGEYISEFTHHFGEFTNK